MIDDAMSMILMTTNSSISVNACFLKFMTADILKN